MESKINLEDQTEPGTFSKFFKSLKKKTFKVFNIILKYDEISKFGVFVICFIELLQLLSFSFSDNVNILLNNSSNIPG
jgi:hypothetical protein